MEGVGVVQSEDIVQYAAVRGVVKPQCVLVRDDEGNLNLVTILHAIDSWVKDLRKAMLQFPQLAALNAKVLRASRILGGFSRAYMTHSSCVRSDAIRKIFKVFEMVTALKEVRTDMINPEFNFEALKERDRVKEALGCNAFHIELYKAASESQAQMILAIDAFILEIEPYFFVGGSAIF